MLQKLLLSGFVLFLAASSYCQSGVWELRKNLPKATTGVAEIIDGNIYFFEHSNQTEENANKANGNVYQYNIKTDTWKEVAAMPEPINSFTYAVLGNKIFIAGGLLDSEGNNSNKVKIYDPASSSWSFTEPLKKGRHGISLCVCNGRLYAFGGFLEKDGQADTYLAEVYNPDTNDWTLLQKMPVSRAWASAVPYKDKIIVAGGYGDNSFLSSYDVYDTKTDSWEEYDPVFEEGYTARLISAGSDIYILGSNYAKKEMYLKKLNPETMTWISAANSPTQRFDYSMAVLDNKIYLIGGFAGDQLLSSADVYDIRTDTWTKIPDCKEAKVNVAAVLANDEIYLIGGQFGWYVKPLKFSDKVEVLNTANLSSMK